MAHILPWQPCLQMALREVRQVCFCTLLCLHTVILMANATILCKAASLSGIPFSVFSQTRQGGRWFLPLQLIFLCFKAVPAACVPNCSPYSHTPASAETECQSCFVNSGAAHNSRSTAGTPSALHQQHLTPAQQATQAAITAPATQQDGKVPVRTGLAWAALGTPFPSFSCMAEISPPPRLHCVWCSNAWAAVGAILPFVRLSHDCRGPLRPLSSLRQSCSTTLFCVTQLAPYKTAVL